MHAITLAQALKSFILEQGWDTKLKNAEVLRIWPEAAGKNLASKAKAVRMSEGTLTVKVDNPVWRNELSYMLPELIKKINLHLREPILQEIRLV